MYITVSLKIELDANASLTQMEQQIQAAGREAMQAALKAAIRQSEDHQQTCPTCGSKQQRSHGTKRRVLLTSFGRVEVPLKWLRCQQCGRRFRPADACLAEVHGSNITPDLRELASLVGSSWPYETAAGVLQRLSGVQLSDERLRQLTNEQGSLLAQQQQTHAQQLLSAAISLPQIRRERAQPAPTTPPEPPQWVQVGLDGGGCPRASKKAAWKAKSGWWPVKSNRSASMGGTG